MAFRNEVFPENISFHAKGGAGFSTEVIVFGAGDESRNRNWLRHRGRWDVAHAARLPTVWKPLQAFFSAVGGRADSFLFKDWFDFEADSSEGVLLPIDSGHWQLAKRFTFGTITYDHPIYKPKVDTIVFSGGGTLVVDSNGVTEGIVLESSAGISDTWSGEFYKPARFDTDEMTGEIIDKAKGGFLVGWDPIPIVEVRLES